MTKKGYDIFWRKAQYIFDQHEMDITGLTDAADEYAKEIAIGFETWRNTYKYESHPNGFYSKENAVAGKQTWFTIDELFTLYLNSLNTKQ
jgi:hypothetical protein